MGWRCMRNPFIQTQYWDIFLNENQAYLGYCVIILKSKKPNLSQVSKEEWDEFTSIVVPKIEKSIKECFSAELFNWACLMNYAYKKDPPKPYVHWHCRPRFRNPVTFANIVFEDTEFAHHYDRKRKQIVDEEILIQIENRIKENF